MTHKKVGLASRPAQAPKAHSALIVSALLLFAAAASAQTVDLAAVISKPVSRTVELPGEFQPFLSAPLHAKVPGYVERVWVDRGSAVKEGDLLVELTAPEISAQIAEAQSKAQAAASERIQAEAQLAAAQATLERLKKAAETPGAVAGNELIQAEKQVEAAQALVQSRHEAVRAADAVVQAHKDLGAYLKITAPFDGTVTDRFVHPGALVGPGSDPVLLVIQQVSHLRLVVPVPEEHAGGIVTGASAVTTDSYSMFEVVTTARGASCTVGALPIAAWTSCVV